MKSEISSAIELFIKNLEEMNIPYFIGGSIASSVYGISRATMDIDLISELKVEHVNQLIQNLNESYFIDEEMIIDAIKNKSSFNLIHLSIIVFCIIPKNRSGGRFFDFERFLDHP